MNAIFGFDNGLGIASVVISAVPSVAFSIALYVLMSLGLYTIAKRRGIDHAWLAWIPVAEGWLLGSVSDQFRYVTRGEVRSKRKSLLVLGIIQAILAIAMIAVMAAVIVTVISGTIHGLSEDALLESVMGPVLDLFLLCIPVVAVAIALAIIRYMALYDLYTSVDPGNNVLFLVFSILFSVTMPFFVFFNRNKDLGMPARRDDYAPQPQWQPAQSGAEPWEQNDRHYL